MGTSTDRDGGSGGAWTPLKVAATNLAKRVESNGFTRTDANRVFARHVEVLDGPLGATSTATAARAGFAELADFLTTVADVGFDEALAKRGLSHLVGLDRFDVLDELVTELAGSGSSLEAQAARDAQIDTLDHLLGEAQEGEELSAIRLDESGVVDLLTEFLARYVYNRIPTLALRLARLLDPERAAAADSDFVEWLRDAVSIQLPPDPTHFDWVGPAGRNFVEQVTRDAYQVIASWEAEDD